MPEVVARNQTAGDPHAGRFTYEEAVAGLPEGSRLLAILNTDAGEIRCTLDPSEAPIAVANFVGLARGLRPFQDALEGPWHTAPYYDGTAVHRVQDGNSSRPAAAGPVRASSFRTRCPPDTCSIARACSPSPTPAHRTAAPPSSSSRSPR
ncbi:peptidylprolyl isomerase [Nannocystis pusilla]|uniref:peptidylprolyl isomerase n=1 Tax=Nannocystis pusilla TaxID=889268 RepID=UPI003B804F55